MVEKYLEFLFSPCKTDCIWIALFSPWWHFILGNLRFLGWYAKAMNYIVAYWDLCLSYHLSMTLTHSCQFTSLAEAIAITLKMLSKILFKVFSKLCLGEMHSNEPCGAVICSEYHTCPWSCCSSSSTPSPCKQPQLVPFQFLGDGWGVLLQEERKQEVVSIIKHRSVWYQASLDLFFMEEPVYTVGINCDNWWVEVD